MAYCDIEYRTKEEPTLYGYSNARHYRYCATHGVELPQYGGGPCPIGIIEARVEELEEKLKDLTTG